MIFLPAVPKSKEGKRSHEWLSLVLKIILRMRFAMYFNPPFLVAILKVCFMGDKERKILSYFWFSTKKKTCFLCK